MRELKRRNQENEGFYCPLGSQEQRQQFQPVIGQLIRERRAEVLLSFSFHAALSEVCQKQGILYFSLLTAAEELPWYQTQAHHLCNVFFTADSVQLQECKRHGLEQVFYLPFAAGLEKQARREGESREGGMQAENSGGQGRITFAGSGKEHIVYDRLQSLPEMMKGYLDGITQSQALLYNVSIYKQVIDEKLLASLMQLLKLHEAGENKEHYRALFEGTILSAEVTRQERRRILGLLSKEYESRFCWHSPYEEGAIGSCQPQRNIPYGDELYQFYRDSAVNLNLTNRAWQCGIPLRVWDVLYAGGFLITNYQADLMEYFEPGKELVIFEDAGDLVEKAGFYLKHEEERRRIAKAGCAKVRREHTWEKRLEEMFSIL